MWAILHLAAFWVPETKYYLTLGGYRLVDFLSEAERSTQMVITGSLSVVTKGNYTEKCTTI